MSPNPGGKHNNQAPDQDISGNPLGGWLRSFRSEFKVSSNWFARFLQSVLAVFWKLVSRTPWRVERLLAHLAFGFAGLLTWLFYDSLQALRGPLGAQEVVPKGDPSAKTTSASLGVRTWLWGGVRAFLAWFGRLVAKAIDLLSLGELIDVVTMILKVNTRGLTEVEIAEARKVFGDSLTYWRVRLDEWSLIANLGKWVAERRSGRPVGHMAVTVFSTIHFSRRIHPEPGNEDMAWLIHELTHVAQMEHVGSQFMGEALHAQGTEGYAYGGPEALRGRDFASFNREQQGDIAKDYYRSLYGRLTLTDDQRRDYERLITQLRQGRL